VASRNKDTNMTEDGEIQNILMKEIAHGSGLIRVVGFYKGR
jgi:hypothetical protein